MNDYKLLSRIYHDVKLRDQYNAIYEQRFNSDSTYRLPLTIRDTSTAEDIQLFVVLTPEIYETTISIMQQTEHLENLIQELPVAAIHGHIMNYILVDELIKTNEIEGVHSTRREILDAVTANKKREKEEKQKLRFVNQARQYMKILARDKFNIDTPQQLRALYDEFLEGELRNDELPDGMIFRKDSVDVKSPTGKILHTGLMPEQAIIMAVQNLINFYQDDTYPSFLRIAIAHYYLGYIHPFYDGNGRFGRLLSSILLANDFNDLVALRLSVTIHENIKAYYRAFEAVNNRLNKGDATTFYAMFLHIIEQATNELLVDLTEKEADLIYAKESVEALSDLGDDGKKTIYVMLQASIFSDINLSIKSLMQNLEFSRNKMLRILNSLESKGYITVDKEHKPYQYILDEQFNQYFI